MRKDVAAAFANTGLSTLELQILNARKRRFPLDAVAAVLNISLTSLKRTRLPAINDKLNAKHIHESIKKATELGLLPPVSDRKVAHVMYSPQYGVVLREVCNCSFFSKLMPSELEEAQIFDDLAAAREVIDRIMPNQKWELEFRRVDVHCFATTSTREECVAAGLPSWDSDFEDDELAWAEENGPSNSYH